MRVLITFILAIVAIAVVAADRSSSAASLKPVDDDMHHFMEYVFEPAYLRLKQSMATQPADKNAWKPVKGDALMLAEVTALLLARAPEQGQADWSKHSLAVRKEAAGLYQAARKQDHVTARKAYTSMLTQCNACHKQFADGEHQLKP